MSSSDAPQADMNPSPGAPGKQAGKSVLVKGCAIGCGAMIVLGVFGGIGAYFLVRSGMGKMATAMSHQLASDFDAMQDAGKVPEKDRLLYEELVDDAQNPQATFASVLLSTAIVRSHLEDGAVTDAEREEAETTRDFLADHPAASMFEVNAFMKQHDGVRQKVESFQRTMNPGTLLAPKQ